MARKRNSIEDDLSPIAKNIIEAVVSRPQPLSKSGKKTISVALTDPFGRTEMTPEQIVAEDKRVAGMSPLVKSVMNLLNGPGDTIERLAFDTDPSLNNTYQSLYKVKQRLLPDDVLKRIGIQDDLVAAICNARSNQMASFGRPQPDRFSTGYKIEPGPGVLEGLSDQEKKKLQDKISAAELKILSCGQTRGWKDVDALSFGQFLHMQARNACLFGRIATEAIYSMGFDGKKKFHSFRPIDAGTIYRAAPQKEAGDAVRRQARKLLEQVKNKDLEPERFQDDEYSWVQVIAGRPVQAFTAEECLLHNFYPVTDVELDGYPLTPLDTIITAVTTHINIGNHNKLYFQSGRAARGMIVIKSDDADDGVIKHIRQQFQASINSVGNAWRMPIFGVGTDDDIGWYPIDNSSRDMEFQYLSDTNARVILSGFQMSPEELPGYAHLSRGTNNQALSESNNEYKLEAHRDVGIRPMLAQFQNFVNAKILPLIDEELSKMCSFKFVGLDVETAEKESTRLQQDMAVHMNMDEVLDKVEKKPVGKEWGGQFLLNPQWQAVLDKYVPQGAIMEHFFGMKGASKDPRYDFLNNPNYFTQMQLLMQQQQMEQQAQMAAQQPPPSVGGGGDGSGDGGGSGGPEGGEGSDDGGNGGDGQDAGGQPQQGGDDTSTPDDAPQDLTRSLDQLTSLLTKSEAQMPTSRRKLLAQQRMFVKKALQSFEHESQEALKEIVSIADKHKPATKRKSK